MRDPPTAQNIHSQMTLGNSAPALRVTGLAFEHDCCKSHLCSPGALEVHPPEPKQKSAAVQDEQLAGCKDPGTAADSAGMALPGSPGLRSCVRAGGRQGKAVSLEHSAPAPAALAARRVGGCVCVQLQHWARHANGKQKQFKLPGAGRNTNNIMAWSWLQSC